MQMSHDEQNMIVQGSSVDKPNEPKIPVVSHVIRIKWGTGADSNQIAM